MSRHLWAALAWISLVLGIIGAILPVMPTVPFIIVSAYAASRGSKRLRSWLTAHPKFSQPILDWEQHGTVTRRTKWVSTLMMTGSTIGMMFTTSRWWIPVVAGSIMALTAIWLWLRPEPHPCTHK